MWAAGIWFLPQYCMSHCQSVRVCHMVDQVKYNVQHKLSYSWFLEYNHLVTSGSPFVCIFQGAWPGKEERFWPTLTASWSSPESSVNFCSCLLGGCHGRYNPRPQLPKCPPGHLALMKSLCGTHTHTPNSLMPGGWAEWQLSLVYQYMHVWV